MAMKAKKKTTTKKVRRGDKVLVIAGNYKGETGTVLRKEKDRVLVQGINMKKKHVKPTEQNPRGDILSIERTIHISNVCVCVDEGTPVKLKAKVKENKERVFTYQKDGKETEYRSIKKSEK